jgi:hypothetical protein
MFVALAVMHDLQHATDATVFPDTANSAELP